MAGRSFRPIGRPPRHGEDGAAHILLQLFLPHRFQPFGESLYTFRSAVPDKFDIAAIRFHLFRINQEDGLLLTDIVQQSGRRINVERGADHDENITILDVSDRLFNFRHRLTEPDDKGTQLSPTCRSGCSGEISYGRLRFLTEQDFISSPCR